MFLMLMSETFGNLLVLPTSIPTPPKRRDVRLKSVHACTCMYKDIQRCLLLDPGVSDALERPLPQFLELRSSVALMFYGQLSV